MVGVAAALALLVGCAVRRIDNGVFRSPKGYRVTIPGPDWVVVESSRADLELRHRGAEAGMLVHATCRATAGRRPPAVLARQLLAGLRERRILERREAVVDGLPATRALLEATSGPDGARMKIEAYVLADGRCAYDLIYAAPPAAFEGGQADFERFVATFLRE